MTEHRRACRSWPLPRGDLARAAVRLRHASAIDDASACGRGGTGGWFWRSEHVFFARFVSISALRRPRIAPMQPNAPVRSAEKRVRGAGRRISELDRTSPRAARRRHRKSDRAHGAVARSTTEGSPDLTTSPDLEVETARIEAGLVAIDVEMRRFHANSHRFHVNSHQVHVISHEFMRFHIKSSPRIGRFHVNSHDFM